MPQNFTSSKSTPHSVAISRIKSDADSSAARIKSRPESTNSITAAALSDPPNPVTIYTTKANYYSISFENCENRLRNLNPIIHRCNSNIPRN